MHKQQLSLRLQQKITLTSSKTGCYLLKNRQNQCIYVGKAKNLQQRIQTHLLTATNPSAKLMQKTIFDWEIFLTNNESEAFILEKNLIKQHLPRFNVILKDDRGYPYLYINSQSRHPRYQLIYYKPIITRGLFYGPFPDRYNGQQILDLLQNLFPLRRCKLSLQTKKPCFYYQLQQCLGACWKEVKQTVYQRQIKKIKSFFRGKIFQIKTTLQQKITIASQNLQFEQAKRWKRLRDNLINFVDQQIVEFTDQIDRDFINYHYQNGQLIIQVFFYRQGKLLHQTTHYTRLYNDDLNETISAYLQMLYTIHPWPVEMIMPVNINLTNLTSIRPTLKIVIPNRGKKQQILQLVRNNCQAKLAAFNLSTSEKNYYALQQLAKISQLNELKTIDFIDLSYLNHSLIVGGITRFLNGWEIPSAQRFYVWNHVTNFNEGKWFTKLVKRAYQNHQLIPNLLLIDGSYQQVAGTTNALKQLTNNKPAVIGLVKNQQHKTAHLLLQKQVKHVISSNQLLLFLQNIQEIGHQRTKNYFNKVNQLKFK